MYKINLVRVVNSVIFIKAGSSNYGEYCSSVTATGFATGFGFNFILGGGHWLCHWVWF
jgi:hypothetical protein